MSKCRTVANMCPATAPQKVLRKSSDLHLLLPSEHTDTEPVLSLKGKKCGLINEYL